MENQYWSIDQSGGSALLEASATQTRPISLSRVLRNPDTYIWCRGSRSGALKNLETHLAHAATG